ncbi:PREDICTED: nucleoporin GLE1-like [Branchiostoma belcheri]|uniref:Nucleoporin GLE1-like n=1 Tax=Branchiostoma belcheri TaxID=7741 RepID=A0A6P4ZNJ0_BRABE|nr:PREDICTED: nucleoporin GLE1-like [Branchiostoma belcheri]
MVSPCGLKQVDLDELAQNFTAWQKRSVCYKVLLTSYKAQWLKDVIWKEHSKELSESSRILQSVKEKHKEQLKQLKDNAAKLKREEGALLQQSIQQKNSELQQLQKQLEDTEREKHSQIVQLKMAYDSKLLKLQKQTATLQQQQRGPSSANHEIFRQKLQALKNQSEQEKSALKRTIGELQQKLNAAQHSHGTKRRKL